MADHQTMLRDIEMGGYFLFTWPGDEQALTCLYRRECEYKVKCLVGCDGKSIPAGTSKYPIESISFDRNGTVTPIDRADGDRRLMLAIHGQGAKAVRLEEINHG